MASKYFQKALDQVSPESKIFVRKNLDITEQVNAILARKGMTRRDLARALGKSEPEVSRMFSGLHNLTLKTLAKLEAALGEEIIMTPQKARERWGDLKEGKVISFTSVGKGFQAEKGNQFHAPEQKSQAMEAYVRKLRDVKRTTSKVVTLSREQKQAM